MENKNIALLDVYRLAEYCAYDQKHAAQVNSLSLRIFDDLRDLHKLETKDRQRLESAAILHDIGWIEGWKAHHKTSLKIILSSPILKMANKERMIVGSIARYHRKGLPHKNHDHFAVLNSEDKKRVKKLAAILRLADSLDHAHNQWINDLTCKTDKHKVKITCNINRSYNDEYHSVAEKKDLFEDVFSKEINIKWKSKP